MRKTLIVLLSVLLIVFFPSCEKDRSEEVIAAYSDFITSSAGQTRAYNALLELTPEITSNIGYVDKTFSSSIMPSTKNVESAFREITDDYVITVDSIISAEGTIKGKRNVSNIEIEADNVKIVFSYTYYSDTLIGTITLSGRLTKHESAEYISYTSCSLILQGTQLKDVSYTTDKSSNSFLSASVDGMSVELRLLNADK